MARRKKPCDFCQEDWTSDYVEHRNGYCIWAEIYPFNNVIAFNAQANNEDGELIEDYISIRMDYCPQCGRKLDAL